MATRCRIAVARPGGAFESIYCHWDGYPSGVGRVLLDHYTDPDKVEALIALGDLSSLGEALGDRHDFGSPGHPEWCEAYGRDRGEVETHAISSTDLRALQALTQQCGGEYLYVFDSQARTWSVAEGGVALFGLPATRPPSELRPLTDVLSEDEENP
jgi:hypothetical protein